MERDNPHILDITVNDKNIIVTRNYETTEVFPSTSNFLSLLDAFLTEKKYDIQIHDLRKDKKRIYSSFACGIYDGKVEK